MKKLLALVLALVMSMSLVTISNAAFKDADKIDYKEAVDVMNAVDIGWICLSTATVRASKTRRLRNMPASRLLTPSTLAGRPKK